MDLRSFETAFSDRAGSCRVQCACGNEFYCDDGTWQFDESELDELKANPNATALDWSPGYISFDGRTFALDCTCWHERANQVMSFLDAHAIKIAEYFGEERKRLQAVADAVPVL